MTEVWTWLASLPSNPMFSGLTGATVIGGLLVLARRVPLQLWQWFLMAISAQVTVKSQDPVFWWMVNWLSASNYGRSARRMRLESVVSHDAAPGQPEGEAKFVLSPADGQHWFFYRGALVVVSRGKEGSPSTSTQSIAREEISVRAFTTDSRAFMARLIEEAQQSVLQDDESVKVYHHQTYGWCIPIKVPRRPVDSVILRDGVMESLAADALKFLSSRQWYRERCIPWRRGYMLHGEPGCGKSSIAHALASHLGLNVAILSLSSVVGDGHLRELMLALPARTLLLIEDIDSAFAQRDGDDAKQITFSGLLNAIDGIAAAEGRLLVMTTNHIDKIDPALRRPGRSDVEVLIELADVEQARRMFLRFFPHQQSGAWEFGLQHAGSSPASIQGKLMAHRDGADVAREPQTETA